MPSTVPPPETTISFRSHLVSAIREFLRENAWTSPDHAEAAAELVTALSQYREEGRRLFPVAFFTRDLGALLTELGGKDPLLIGRGRLNPRTMRRALKQCAPLGEGRSWVIYLLVNGDAYDQVEFGVFRTTGSQIQPTALERLRRIESPSTPILGVVQLAENVVEIRASKNRYRYIHLSGHSADGEPPTKTTRDFTNAITHDVSPQFREPLSNFYYRVIIDVMQVWHGTLAAVLPKGAPVPEFLQDGVILEKPIDIEERVGRVCEARGNGLTLIPGELQAESYLVRGMLGADGITILSSDGKILGYNVFLKNPAPVSSPQGSEGGARWRTYKALADRVGDELVAAFYRSQDGSANCTSQYAVKWPETHE